MTRKATRRGLLDGITALDASAGYQAYLSDSPDVDPQPDDVNTWLKEMQAHNPAQAKRLPKERPNVTVLDLHGVLVVRPTLRPLVRAVQAAKCHECNVKPPPGAEQHVVMEAALQTMIDALFAISGEVQPGWDLYCGASTSAVEGIKWRRVGKFHGAVTVLNPRRREVQNASLMIGAERLEQSADTDETSSAILPPDKRKVTFKEGDNLTQRLLRETRRINVPFAHPDNDHSRPEVGTPEPAMPQHRAAVVGQAGQHETRVTSSGGVALRDVVTLGDMERDDDPFNVG